MYILIVIMLGGYVGSVEMQEFDTYKTCTDAANYIKSLPTGRWAKIDKAECVKK